MLLTSLTASRNDSGSFRCAWVVFWMSSIFKFCLTDRKGCLADYLRRVVQTANPIYLWNRLNYGNISKTDPVSYTYQIAFMARSIRIHQNKRITITTLVIPAVVVLFRASKSSGLCVRLSTSLNLFKGLGPVNKAIPQQVNMTHSYHS